MGKCSKPVREELFEKGVKKSEEDYRKEAKRWIEIILTRALDPTDNDAA